eukprot:4950200-Prymnesium_polylepis.1
MPCPLGCRAPRRAHTHNRGSRARATARSARGGVRARERVWARGCETGCDDREFRETQPGGLTNCEISETDLRTRRRRSATGWG